MRHAGRYWGYAILILISIAVLSVPMVLAVPDSGPGISSNAVNVSAADAYAIMQSRQDSVIIDVRTRQEYQAGHLDGAINLDYYSSGFLDRLKALNKNKHLHRLLQEGHPGRHSIGDDEISGL